MIRINVALPNGHAELFTLLRSSTLRELKKATQQAFGKKYLGVVTAKNQLLVDLDQTLEEAGIEDGECLTALVLQPQLAATSGAFALWCHGDNAVVTWGDEYLGGDSSAVRDQLKGVQQIQASHEAFAAILKDGSVVTWGKAYCGGDSSAVQGQLRGVQQIQAARFGAFAAILSDGSVVTWGHEGFGGDSSELRDQLKGVQQIQGAGAAFAAIVEDGSVVTWGDADEGGDSSAVRDQLKGVVQIQATEKAFAAIVEDGSVVTWGDADEGGDSSAVRDQLKGVVQIQATEKAFAAIVEDGSVVTWGDADEGGDSSAVRDQLKGVVQIQATEKAFAAILKDGSVVTWGYEDFGGDSSAVQGQLNGVLPLLRFWTMDPSLPGVMECMAVTVRQFNMYSGLISLVVFADWQGLSCHIEIILVGAPPQADWWIKRIATNAARGHAMLRLATERGATQFDHGTHGTHLNSQSMCLAL